MARKRIVHLLVLSLLATGLSAHPAAAVQPDDVLLFVGEVHGDTGIASQLSTVRADGTGVATLATKSDGGFSHPTWSPDGSRVACGEHTGGASTETALVVRDRSGANPVVLSTTVWPQGITWSPDGTRIAVGSADGVWVFAADGSSSGSHVVQTEYLVEGVDWSPDGSRIAFAEDTGKPADEWPRLYRIRTVRPDGSDGQSLTDGTHTDRDPMWSPDGQLLLFKRVEGRAFIDLMVMSPTGADQRVISAKEDRPEAVFNYDWSPDSSRIVFSAQCDCIGHPDSGLYIADADGTTAQALLPFDDASEAEGYPAYVHPVWSPDGASIAFITWTAHPDGPGSVSQGVHLIEADGTDVRLVYDNFDMHRGLSFAPRPDGGGDENEVTTDVPGSTDGQPVTVTAEMPAGVVEVTFSQVTSGGSMTVVRRAPTSAEDAPGFTVLGTAFDISVSGVEFGSAEVCVPFDTEQAASAGLTEEDLGLHHVGSDGIRRNVTTTLDMGTGVVCGRVSEFSPFLVGHSRLDRLAGPNRTSTAAAIASASFSPGVPVAYIATQADYPDALAGGPAAAGHGPILLVTRDTVPEVTGAELQRLQPLKIVVLGGTSVVSAAVQEQLKTFTAGEVTRISGDNRYDTAASISRQHFDAGVPVAYVATGMDFPDALAGGAAAAAEGGPVVLVRNNAIPPATATELDRLNPAAIVLLGGPSAVSEAVREELGKYTDGNVTRVSGTDRYTTAAAVLARFQAPQDTVFVATGQKFPDALASVPAAGLTGSPLALVRPDAVPAAVRDQLDRLSPDHLFVLGGHAAVSAALEPALAGTLRERRGLGSAESECRVRGTLSRSFAGRLRSRLPPRPAGAARLVQPAPGRVRPPDPQPARAPSCRRVNG